MKTVAFVACLAGCTTRTETVPVDADDTAPVAHVLTTVVVADDTQGADLDGDSTIDNALAPLGAVLDPVVAERLLTNVHVVALQWGDVDDWTTDASVRVGLLSAVDTDTDGTDNASGIDVFDARGYLDANGRATVAGDGVLAAGRLTAEVPADMFQVGTIAFAVATPVHVDATPTAEHSVGTLAFGVTVDALASALTAEGVDDSLIALIGNLADLDLDGDGTPEAVSMAFAFDATSCALADVPVLADETNRDGACVFNRECPADQRCDCVDYVCGCADGGRGYGVNGVDTCTVGGDCASSLCVEGSGADFYCTDACGTNDDCVAALPECIDVAFIGRICTRG